MTERQLPGRLVTRSVDFVQRAASESESGDGRTLDGYAAVFDTPTEINSWEGVFTETLARGAFRKTLRERKPVLQFDHGRDMRTGSVPIGAFQTLEEDDHGLHVVARLFDNPVVEPIRQAIEGEAISGMSFRFEIMREEWTDNRTGKKIKPEALRELLWSNEDPANISRNIREVRLFEAGPVVFPQYVETSVGVRSGGELTPEDRARLLRMLQDEADLIASRYHADDEDPTPEPSTSDPVTPTPEPVSTSDDQHSEGDPTVPPDQPTIIPERNRNVDPQNMTVAERQARRAEIRSRMTEIDSEYAGAPLTDEIRSEWDRISAEYDEHGTAIEEAEERRSRLQAMAGDAEPAAPAAPARRGGHVDRPMVPRAGARTAENIYDMGEIRRLARSIDDMPGLLRDHALRAVEAGHFDGVPAKGKDDAQAHVEHLLRSVDDKDGSLARRVLATGSPTYQRAFGKVAVALNANVLSNEERAALSLGTDTAGGYAVPFDLDPSVILTSAGVINPLRQISRVVQIVGKEWQGLTSAGITVSRDSEAEEVSDDSPSFGQPTVRTVRVQGFVAYSNELEMDWASMRSELTMMLSDAKAMEEGTSFITGNGAGNAPGGIPGSLDYATCVVDGGGSFASADLYAVEEDLSPRWRGRASWLANRSIYNKARQLGSASDGGDLWVRLGAGLPPELIGYSAYEASAMTTTTAGTNDRVLVFGDFSQFLIVDRIGMTVDLVPHLFGANRRPTGQRGLYAMWRNNSKVLVQDAFRFLSNIS